MAEYGGTHAPNGATPTQPRKGSDGSYNLKYWLNLTGQPEYINNKNVRFTYFNRKFSTFLVPMELKKPRDGVLDDIPYIPMYEIYHVDTVLRYELRLRSVDRSTYIPHIKGKKSKYVLTAVVDKRSGGGVAIVYWIALRHWRVNNNWIAALSRPEIIKYPGQVKVGAWSCGQDTHKPDEGCTVS